MPDLYDIALRATDRVLGAGSYARINAGHPDPGVQAAIERTNDEECVFIAEEDGPSCGVTRRWHGGIASHAFVTEAEVAQRLMVKLAPQLVPWQCVCGERFAEPIEEQTPVPQSEPLLLVVSPCCHSLHYWRVSS